jgi:hypothetical protein
MLFMHFRNHAVVILTPIFNLQRPSFRIAWSEKESTKPPEPQLSTLGTLKAVQLSVCGEASSSIASLPSSPTGPFDPDDFLPQ